MTERIVASDAGLDELEASRTFEAFYQAEARTLFRRLWLVTGSRAEAEELMQDALACGSDGTASARWTTPSGTSTGPR